jgi:hypothetical protein
MLETAWSASRNKQSYFRTVTKRLGVNEKALDGCGDPKELPA